MQGISINRSANVTDMSGPLHGQLTVAFDQVLEKWNVRKVVSMARVFNSAIKLHPHSQRANWRYERGASWDVGNVHDMSEMFQHAPAFNQPIGDWDVSQYYYVWRECFITLTSHSASGMLDALRRTT